MEHVSLLAQVSQRNFPTTSMTGHGHAHLFSALWLNAPIRCQTLSYDRRALTSPSDSVLCLSEIQHTLLSSGTSHSPMLKLKSVCSHSDRSDQTPSYNFKGSDALSDFVVGIGIIRSIAPGSWIKPSRTTKSDSGSGPMRDQVGGADVLSLMNLSLGLEPWYASTGKGWRTLHASANPYANSREGGIEGLGRTKLFGLQTRSLCFISLLKFCNMGTLCTRFIFSFRRNYLWALSMWLYSLFKSDCITYKHFFPLSLLSTIIQNRKKVFTVHLFQVVINSADRQCPRVDIPVCARTAHDGRGGGIHYATLVTPLFQIGFEFTKTFCLSKSFWSRVNGQPSEKKSIANTQKVI